MLCSESGTPDFLAWCHTKNGEFSVRIAYHLEMQQRSGSERGSGSDPNKQLWSRILRATVPHVNSLVWRVVCNGLLIMCSWACRGMLVETTCPRCAEGYENISHLVRFSSQIGGKEGYKPQLCGLMQGHRIAGS